ncbi:hypothetical protein L195_g025132 [Trifolium pratense]|uniref:Uncharacterized protein n=1 Tax=Trifolium pratense TaxID=57577 RepID=A0A2K3NFN2_TRIPR|nr:hypothetical protein L195_g025132 [Trifolium pratense]
MQILGEDRLRGCLQFETPFGWKLGTQKDVGACTRVPIEVKVLMWEVVASLQQKLVKKTQIAQFEEPINVIA